VKVATSICVCAFARSDVRAASIRVALALLNALACSPFHRLAW
jgi:hypothetical protein